METSEPTPTADTVRVYAIETAGNANIVYYFFMVDFDSADLLNVNSTSLVNVEGSENEVDLIINCELSGNTNPEASKTYLIPYLTQIPSGSVLKGVEVSDGSNTKKGQVKGVKLNSLPALPGEKVNSDTTTPLKLYKTRNQVLLSETTESYHIIVLSRTDSTYSKTAGLTPVDNNNLMVSYNSPQDNDPSQANGEYLVAAAKIHSSTSGEYANSYFDIEDPTPINYSAAVSL